MTSKNGIPELLMDTNLTEYERKEGYKFIAEHKIYCPDIQKKSHYSLSFHNGSIGVGVEIKCKTCGKIKDITDYGSW